MKSVKLWLMRQFSIMSSSMFYLSTRLVCTRTGSTKVILHLVVWKVIEITSFNQSNSKCLTHSLLLNSKKTSVNGLWIITTHNNLLTEKVEYSNHELWLWIHKQTPKAKQLSSQSKDKNRLESYHTLIGPALTPLPSITNFPSHESTWEVTIADKLNISTIADY